MSLENIVRPFQTREVTPPRIALAKPLSSAQSVTSADTVHLVFGKSWSVKSVNGSENIDVSYYAERWIKEKKAPTGQQGFV